MEIIGIDLTQARKAASDLDIELYNVRATSRGFACILKPATSGNRYRRLGFQHGPSDRQRRIHATCWHGHYEWMQRLYELNPNAVIRSSMATYKSRAEFERSAGATGYRNIGSQMRPLSYEDACTCGREEDYPGAVGF